MLKTTPKEPSQLDLKNSRVGIILQVRSGSTRLPRKAHKLVGEKTLLQTILSRLLLLTDRYKVIVATTTLPSDLSICKEATNYGFEYFTGSEDDVLSRYYHCASKYNFDHVVRLTGDNPFTDLDALQALASFHLSDNYDYSQNQSVLPLGIGSEIFSFESLERCFNNAYLPNHREHVNEYILDNPTLFKIGIPASLDIPSAPAVHLTIDTVEDLELARAIFHRVKKSYITADEAIRCAQDLKITDTYI